MAYFKPHDAELCGDCPAASPDKPAATARLQKRSVSADHRRAPPYHRPLCDPCAAHFAAVRDYLAAAGLPYKIESGWCAGWTTTPGPSLRWCRRVWALRPRSVVADATTVSPRSSGVAHTPAVGFAAGIERIILNLREQGCPLPSRTPLTSSSRRSGEEAKLAAVRLAEDVRGKGLATVVGAGERGMRARLRQADSSGAKVVVILGEDELREEQATVKNLAGGDQQRVSFSTLGEHLAQTVRRKEQPDEGVGHGSSPADDSEGRS